jgi:hypothetical protein
MDTSLFEKLFGWSTIQTKPEQNSDINQTLVRLLKSQRGITGSDAISTERRVDYEALVAAIKGKSVWSGAAMVAVPMIRSEDVRDKLRPMTNGLFSKDEREIECLVSLVDV